MVSIPGRLRGKVTGLCGSSDGIQSNDLNVEVDEVSLTFTPAEYGNFWKRQPPFVNPAKYEYYFNYSRLVFNWRVISLNVEKCVLFQNDI